VCENDGGSAVCVSECFSRVAVAIINATRRLSPLGGREIILPRSKLRGICRTERPDSRFYESATPERVEHDPTGCGASSGVCTRPESMNEPDEQTRHEIRRRAREIYERDVKHIVEADPALRNKRLIIDTVSGAHEVDDELMTAIDRVNTPRGQAPWLLTSSGTACRSKSDVPFISIFRLRYSSGDVIQKA